MDVTVVTVDDSAAFRTALADVVGAVEGFRLVGEGNSGEEAVRLVAALRPDLVLLDDRLGDVDGVAAATRIAALRLPAVVVLVTAGDADALRERARRAGVAAVVDKRLVRPDLLRELWAEHGR